MNNPDNEKLATFTAYIENVPDQDSKGNYQDTGYRSVEDKRTGKVTSASYNYNWYQFSGVLTSIVLDEQEECEIPPDFEINICIASKSNSENNDEYRAYLKKRDGILLRIKIYSDIRFRGVPQRLDKSRDLLTVEPTDIENAHEIYISPNYIDTIHVERPTREIQKKQNQYARSKAKERSRGFKSGLWVRLRWFRQDIAKYVTENKIQLLVGFFLTVAGVVIGGAILYWLRIS